MLLPLFAAFRLRAFVPATSQPPAKPASSGSLKYVLVGLLFLGAAAGVWMIGLRPPAPAPAPAPTPKEPERANPLADQGLVLEEEPAPEPEAPVEEPTKQKSSRPKAGEWECSGDLAGATAVINENRTQIRSCYERRLKVNNLLQGDVRLRVKVGTTGKVVATATAGSLRDAEVLGCMRNIAQGWSFGVPQGGNCAVLSIPFKFSPKAP
jgi:hypothetical protein